VTVSRMPSIAARERIVRRRLAFDEAPENFLREWAEEDQLVTNQILVARARLERVRVPDPLLTIVARLTHELNAPGHRADITLIKAARAHAASLEKESVEVTDLLPAARLALAHRVPSSPLDSPEQLQQRIDRVFQQLAGGDGESETVTSDEPADAFVETDEDLDDMAEKMQIPGNCAAGSVLLSFLKKKTSTRSLTPTNA
jgi:magnesium chelatase subunit I